jgi:hypothetical protein
MISASSKTLAEKNEENLRLLRERYDAGVPWFTREALKDLAEQLAKNEQFVYVKDFDGKLMKMITSLDNES